MPDDRPGWRAWFAGLLVIGALIAAVLHWGELRNFAQLALRARPEWLLVAALLQSSTYFSLAQAWRPIVVRSRIHPPALRMLVRIAFAKLFADQTLPTAGMGGTVLLVDQLVRQGVSRASAVAVLLLAMLGFYIAYLLFALAALLVLWLNGDNIAPLVGFVTTFVLVSIAIPALALWLRKRGSEPLPPLLERFGPIRKLLTVIAEAPATLLADRVLLGRVVAWHGCIFAADILTLFACLQALGAGASLGAALVAFMLASMAVTLGPIPFGLGSFEVVCTAMLRLLGTEIEAALAATPCCCGSAPCGCRSCRGW